MRHVPWNMRHSFYLWDDKICFKNEKHEGFCDISKNQISYKRRSLNLKNYTIFILEAPLMVRRPENARLRLFNTYPR